MPIRRLVRLSLVLLLGLGLAACARSRLDDPPMPLGDFALGLNIAVADKVQMVPISRKAEPKEWETAMQKAIDDRFGEKRYQGTKLYNIGISIDGYALAPPGIPVVASPKSVLVITANIWDDAAQKKLNPEGHQITVFESLSGETVIGSGLTRSKEKQMEILAANAARKVEDWLLEHPEWFGMTKEQQKEALAKRRALMQADEAAAGAEAPPPATPAQATPEQAPG